MNQIESIGLHSSKAEEVMTFIHFLFFFFSFLLFFSFVKFPPFIIRPFVLLYNTWKVSFICRR